VTAQPLETRMARLEGAYEQICDRLNGIDQRLFGLQQRFDSLRSSMDRKFLWVMGLVLVSILLPLVQRYVPHG
jgi:hypothetical protein